MCMFCCRTVDLFRTNNALARAEGKLLSDKSDSEKLPLSGMTLVGLRPHMAMALAGMLEVMRQLFNTQTSIACTHNPSVLPATPFSHVPALLGVFQLAAGYFALMLAHCKQRLHLLMLSITLLQAVDTHHSCWSSLWYWKTLVNLSLQQTGGRQGPQAVAVAEQLMKEKHSVFMARWVWEGFNAVHTAFLFRLFAR